jgi:alpha-glucosidase
MFFTKYPHASNFSFASLDPSSGELLAGDRACRLRAEAFAGDVYRLRVENRSIWKPHRRIVELESGAQEADLGRLKLLADGFEILGAQGKPLLRTARGQGIGLAGDASMFQFEATPESRFFGMGEKNFGRLELSGLRTKYWNTDVWGDFHFAQWLEHPADPPYASVPYLIVRQDGAYLGLLLDNPYPAFMETPGRPGGQEVFVEWQRTSPRVVLGSEGGEPCLWIVVGPSLAELTCKLQKLVGTTPLPPLWALGYHQSRWGYAGEKDLLELDRRFQEAGVPCDGLWLDIDYMHGYRVFTYDKAAFPNGPAAAFEKLAKKGRSVVAILDPGVKREPGYCAFDEGLQAGVYCQNREGSPFVGMVWPGETVFPDFSIAKGRSWWAGKTRDFARHGFGGFWLDMNDPSTGPVDPAGMLFNAGREPHEAHRNQYALGMQQATWLGLRAAKPSLRPFLLTRSAYTGTSRYSAVWTGDNLSNRFYLRMCIPTTLNLALSGIPFNGCDVGGFGGDTDEALMLDWTKACFLFPFFRNHTSKDTREQEPWAFSQKGNAILRRYIRLRYKLLPYLYQLFARQEESGEAILRPLLHDFEGPYEDAADQFLVGPYLLQAPFLEEGAKRRRAALPGPARWYDARNGKWLDGSGKAVELRAAAGETPLFVRDGAVVPMRPGVPRDNRTDLRQVELHVFVPPGWSGSAKERYVADDGKTTAYRRGRRSELLVRAASDGEVLRIETEQTASGYGRIRAAVVLHGPRRAVVWNGKSARLAPASMRLTGAVLRVWRVEA